MAKFAVFFVAVLAFHAALAAPKKNQGQQGGASKNQIEEVANQVQAVVNDVSTSLQKVLPDQKQVTDTLSQTSQNFAKEVEDIIKKLEAEIEKNKGSNDQVLKEVVGKLTENINTLKQAVGPDATAKATEIRNQIETQFKNSAENVNKLLEIVKPNLEQAGETVNTFAKDIFSDFLKSAEEFRTNIDNALQISPKKSKH